MNQRLVFAVAIVVVVMVAGTAILFLQQQSPTAPSRGNQPAAFVVQGASTVNTAQKLQLRLSVNATYTGGQDGNVAIHIKLDEYNTLQDSYDKVLTSNAWGLSGLSLGSCGDGIYPFGIAVYAGDYVAGNSSEASNLTQASPLPIFNTSQPCPQYVPEVSGYLFSPASNVAVVLPGNASAVQIGSNLTATTVYRSGVNTSTSPINLGPGTYTVAAGDEWDSVVAVHFTIGEGSSTTSASVAPQFAALSVVLGVLPAAAMSRTRLRGNTWETGPCAI